MSQPRAADILRDYLAERDIPCESCGYNLRGVETVQCPECGTVIPRPPADYVARTAANPDALRLYCEECGYTVSGVNAPRCPECGSHTLSGYSGERPPRIHRWRRLPRIPILILVATSPVVLITCIAGAYARSAGRRGSGNAWNGVLISVIPLIIAGGLIWWRAPLARLEPAERKAISAVAMVASVVCLLLALRTLA